MWARASSRDSDGLYVLISANTGLKIRVELGGYHLQHLNKNNTFFGNSVACSSVYAQSTGGTDNSLLLVHSCFSRECWRSFIWREKDDSGKKYSPLSESTNSTSERQFTILKRENSGREWGVSRSLFSRAEGVESDVPDVHMNDIARLQWRLWLDHDLTDV